jgi:choice-of-anchor B domain-containing protein
MLAGGLLMALWCIGMTAAHACGCANQTICAQIQCCGCGGDGLGNNNPPVSAMGGAFDANNMELLSHVNFNQMSLVPNPTGVKGSAVTGWTDPLTGREYAIFGKTNGTSFLDITSPTAPVYLGDMPTNTGSSPWREMGVYRNYLYVVSDANGNHGMQVFDLTRLRGVTTPQSFAPNKTYRSFVDPNLGPLQMNTSHTLTINPQSGYLYLNGSNNYNGAINIVSLADPANPAFVRGATQISGSNQPYIHDAQSIIYHGPDTRFQGKEILINSQGGGALGLIDATNKNDLQLIKFFRYPQASYAHQGAFTEDHRFFLANDELDEIAQNSFTRTHIWDMRVLDAPVYLGYYQHTTRATDHNLFIKGNLVFESNYTAGLRVFDLSNLPRVADGQLPVTQALVPVGYFDTKPGVDQSGFNGSWHNYPYFASGTILISDIEDGLFIVRLANAASASFVRQDTATSGNWNGTYGTEGYHLAGAGAVNPSYGAVTFANHANWVWASSTPESRALLKPGSSDRIAACWYSGSSFNVRINNTDTNQHQVALYLLDWDNYGAGGRQARVEAWDTARQVKLGEQIVSNFQNGKYVVWKIQGDVTFRIVNLRGNAVVSGVFFDPVDNGPSASFVGFDTSTQGNWPGAYGTQGYHLAGAGALAPSYSTVTFAHQQSWTWAASTTEERALRKPDSTDRIAACWYTLSNFNIRIANTDTNQHRVALYLLDWDHNNARQVRVEAWNTATNTKLAEQVVSNFRNGTYVIWNLRGDVTFKIVNLGTNAVVSGVFFE